jgi:hypothetical protein
MTDFDDCYQTVKDGYGGFDEMTVSRTLAMMLNQIKVPTIESGKVIKFRPSGASSFGGYIYRSGVVMIFNEHTAPFGNNKVSLKDALKTLLHKSHYGYIPLYKKIERDRAMWLMQTGQKYEDVYGYDGMDGNCNVGDCCAEVKIRTCAVPDEQMASYLDMRFPYRNSIFQKFNEGETTLWEIFRIINGNGKTTKNLAKQTEYARREGEKLSLPVIYPNYHTFVSENKIHKVPNRCVTLDFDLAKQGIDTMKARRIRSQVTCMSETICVCESFTKGNFWALCALGDTQSNHRAVANAVCDEVERRLSIYQVQIDRASCVLSQARFVVYDRAAVIKHPASCFYEPML